MGKKKNQLSYFEDKVVLIISPDRWGEMKLSKHHYAIQLAGLCKRVYFLNPPQKNISSECHVEKEGKINNLHIVSYRPWFNYKIRFHFRLGFDFLMKFQIDRIIRGIGEQIDIAWCFEPNLYSNLTHFKAQLCIFHPVDEIEYSYQKKVAEHADIVFSVSHYTISKFNEINTPAHFVNHGVSPLFLSDELSGLGDNVQKSGKIKVGYVGNLFLSSLDRESIMNLIKAHPEVFFYFWGPSKLALSNLSGDVTTQVNDWIHWLEKADNVCLQGVLCTGQMAVEINEMDMFFIALDIEKDKNRGANSHKVLEYLSTGKVVVSKNLGEYTNKNQLIEMTNGNSGEELLELFTKVVSNLDYYNSTELQKLRKNFAKDNSYDSQIARIVQKLTELD